MTSKTINTMNAVSLFILAGIGRLNEELEARGMGEQEDPTVAATIVASGVRTLDEFAATAVNLSHGEVTGEELKSQFRKAFPNHKIGDRHGPHYLSLARNGHLSGEVSCRFEPSKAKRQASRKGSVSIDVQAMTDVQKTALATALEGSNPELAASIRESIVVEEPTKKAKKAKK